MNEQLTQFIEHARWFGGKGRPFRVTASARHPLPEPDLPGDEAADSLRSLERHGCAVTVELVTLTYEDDRGGSDLYQVPLAYYRESQLDLRHALVGVWEDDDLGQVFAYDALHDHHSTPLWLQALAQGRRADGLVFHRVGDAELDLSARSTLMTGEQSNSSVAFGDDTLMKLFRRVTPGQNPDIEILKALTEAGNEHVAALHGWIETSGESGETLQLGLLQQFLRTASDGWELALASLRNLYAEQVERAEEAGGDFASEAHRLGVAVAEMHSTLAEHFPTESWGAGDLGRIADQMGARLDEALDVVPALQEHADALRRIFDAIRECEGPVRRTEDPRRPAPRPDAADRPQLEDHRLRGRAGQGPRGAAAPRLGLARRRRDGAVLRLRRGALPDSTTSREPATPTQLDDPSPGSGPTATSPPSCSDTRRPATARSTGGCSPPTPPTRPSTRRSTKPATDQPGCPSRSGRWRG